jgi:hypothetical protein
MPLLLFFMLVFVVEIFILSLGLLPVRPSPTSSSPRDRSSSRSRLLVVLVVGLFSAGWIVVPLLVTPGPAQYTALFFLVIPVLGGVRVATIWHGRHLRSYVLLGLLAGILTTFVSTAAGAFVYRLPLDVFTSEGFLAVWWQHFLRSSWSLIEVFSTATLFVMGTLIGDRLEAMMSARSAGRRVPTETQDHV